MSANIKTIQEINEWIMEATTKNKLDACWAYVVRNKHKYPLKDISNIRILISVKEIINVLNDC